MMRDLTFMMRTLPPLPEAHWLSLRILYREDITPADYEPSGFVRATQPGIHFSSPPLQMSVRGQCATAHNALTIDLFSANLGDEDEGATAPTAALRRVRASGGSAFAHELDLAAMGACAAAQERDAEPRLEVGEELLSAARSAIDEMQHKQPLHATRLAELLATTKPIAERVLERLQQEALLSSYQPNKQARLVLKRKTTALSDGESASDQRPDAEAAATQASEDGSASSPTAIRSSRSRSSPGTAKISRSMPGTPGGTLYQSKQIRKTSRTSTSVPSTPAPRKLR
jgi:hypothetical protein